MVSKKKTKILWNRVFLAVFVLIIFVWLISLAVSGISKKSEKTDDSAKHEQSTAKDSSSLTDNTTNANFDYIDIQSQKINDGLLILVNKDYAYTAPYPTGENVVNAVVFRNQLKIKCFTVKDDTVNLLKPVMESFNSMMSDFSAQKMVDTLILTSGLRTVEYQQMLYDDDLKKTNATVSTLVAVPGHSEHHTGYAFDFSNNADYKNNSKWFIDNSYKYGFVQRYSQDKKNITGIDDEPWHFRYVGEPHAYVMNNRKLCLEEYIEFLKKYPFTKDHLFITDEKNVKYEIYYVPKTDNTTKIPVPKNNKNYTISGNNVDGFIVTIKVQ